MESFTNGNLLLKEISSTWKLEARDENNSRYFFHTSEASLINEGNKCYVIGRKGSGKTALREYISELDNGCNIFTEKLTFKNFPFNTLYTQKNMQYTAPNQYISLWKLLMYSVIAKMMLRNKKIDGKIRESLSSSYNQDKLMSLIRVVPEWLGSHFNILSNVNTTFASDNSLPWISNIEVLEDIIMAHLDNESSYYIIFDELDEDYRDKNRIEDYTLYESLITSLFKAVQDINNIFKRTGKRIYPIVFLRDDIYAFIKDADKNKWSDNKINIEWDEYKLKDMLAFRISKAISLDHSVMNFNSAWKLLTKKYIKFPNEKTGYEGVTSFKYILNSTQLRPRDLVSYITKCAEGSLSYNPNSKFIHPETITRVDKQFSNYLKREITDEIFPVLPDIDEIFRVISEIRKPIFSIEEFKSAYTTYLDYGTIKEHNINLVLQLLFDFSVIGNQHKTQKNKQFFKYKNKEAKFNFSEDLCVHLGLHKALQII